MMTSKKLDKIHSDAVIHDTLDIENKLKANNLEISRRISEKLKVFVHPSIIDKAFDAFLPLHMYPSFDSVIWYNEERCYLFDNLAQVKKLDAYLKKINESLESFEKGWRVK